MQQKLLVVLEEVMILSCEGPELLDAHQQQVVVWVLCLCLPQQPLHAHRHVPGHKCLGRYNIQPHQ